VPNLVTIGQTTAAIWQFLDFSKMAATHYLEFVMSVFGPPTKGIWWSLSQCKIWLESMHMHVFDFTSLAGERLSMPQKLFFYFTL